VGYYGGRVQNPVQRPLAVVSKDGTKLRLIRSGSGPAVVLVHGTMGSKDDWFETSRRLADTYEVTAFDRRGRGESGDSSDYSVDQEVDDLLAVIESAGPPVLLIGHSFGAILAVLAAARRRDDIAKLVLYEPPIGDSNPDGDEWLDELEANIADGDLDTAVASFSSAATISAAEQATIGTNRQASRAQRDAVRTAPREIRAAKAALPIDERLLSAVTVDTLVLIGSEQTDPTYSGLRALADALPNAIVREVPGRHLALVFAPDEYVAEIRDFLGA
jgi:pimeloyl-ACP methyl ester carboxylesterase